MDKDLQSIQETRELLRQAKQAQRTLAGMSQEQLDKITAAIAAAAGEHARRLADMAVEETGFGKKEDKELKNRFAATPLYEAIRDEKTHGILAENRKEILEAFRLPNLVVDGVFSHLYVSDSLEAEDVAYTQEQLTLFYDTVAWLRTAGYDPGKVHIQSSYGLWNLPAQPCDYVRAGIALYGVRSDDAPVQRSLDLRPVLSLRARVASIRTVQAGESAGYGRVFQAEQETKLAVVTIGYADGLPRDLPQRGGQVLIQGRRCPMVGRMCMDQLLVDVSDLSEVAPDDTVTIIGRDGGQVIRAEELAACCGTITNELLSRLGMRLPIVSG